MIYILKTCSLHVIKYILTELKHDFSSSFYRIFNVLKNSVIKLSCYRKTDYKFIYASVLWHILCEIRMIEWFSKYLLNLQANKLKLVMHQISLGITIFTQAVVENFSGQTFISPSTSVPHEKFKHKRNTYCIQLRDMKNA